MNVGELHTYVSGIHIIFLKIMRQKVNGHFATFCLNKKRAKERLRNIVQ